MLIQLHDRHRSYPANPPLASSLREWEENQFEFTVSISQDTLVQTSVEKIAELGVDQTIIEKICQGEINAHLERFREKVRTSCLVVDLVEI